MPSSTSPASSLVGRSPASPLPSFPTTTRRAFLTGALTAPLLPAAMPAGGLFAGGDERLRVGLIGCGGRGTGAALQAAASDPAVRIVALGDVFGDQITSAAGLLANAAREQFVCPDARRFVGEDAFRRVIDSGVDVVLLATPPHARPAHLEAAVAAGKHVYCEKPVAVDAAGVVRAAAAAARARQAGLALVSGFCFRHDPRTVELVSRIRDGAIGTPLAVLAHASIGLPWRKPAAPGRPAAEWPLRNWVSFRRFSGGHLVEHHVQAIDRALWILGDAPPLAAEPAAHDHDRLGSSAIGDCPAATAVRYECQAGASILASIDRRERADHGIVERVVGTAGQCDLLGSQTPGFPGAGPAPGRFQAAIDALVQGILTGRPLHDGDTMCSSTMAAILGRRAAEAGRRVAWQEALHEQPLPPA